MHGELHAGNTDVPIAGYNSFTRLRACVQGKSKRQRRRMVWPGSLSDVKEAYCGHVLQQARKTFRWQRARASIALQGPVFRCAKRMLKCCATCGLPVLATGGRADSVAAPCSLPPPARQLFLHGWGQSQVAGRSRATLVARAATRDIAWPANDTALAPAGTCGSSWLHSCLHSNATFRSCVPSPTTRLAALQGDRSRSTLWTAQATTP